MMNRAPRTRANPRKNLVGFTIGEVRYAIGVENVRQVVNPMETTLLPHMPRAIIGVAEHRGVVIPIVDLRLHYGVPAEQSRKTKWILVDLSGDVVGIVVDAVTGVFAATADEVRPAPTFGSGDLRRGLTGVACHDGRMVFLLDGNLLRDVARPAIKLELPESVALPDHNSTKSE